MRPILNSKIFSAAIGIFVLWLTISLSQLALQKNSVESEVKHLQTKIDETQKHNTYIEKFLTYFQSPAFLEKEARLKLNYKATGENVVFVYKDQNPKPDSRSAYFQETLKNLSNYKKWFYYLLGY